MTHCCSQCSFVAQFESALKMHHQLHHEKVDNAATNLNINTIFNTVDKSMTLSDFPYKNKSMTVPRGWTTSSVYSVSKNMKGLKLAGRTSSATRLFDKLRARICRSKVLSVHPEESADTTFQDLAINETCVDMTSDCTSKALKPEVSRMSEINSLENKEIFSCHLCNFDADRITVLDRHLLNDHKISLENLLKLVMAKTREGLTECAGPVAYGIREPYYKSSVDIMQEGEFVVETVTPKIKILKHAATNTDTQWTETDIPDFKDNCQMITREIEKLLNKPTDACDKDSFLEKMQILNECMCKFVDSSNTLKKTLTKEFGSKHSVRERASLDQPLFNLSLGNSETPRDWERAHSEQMERGRSKYSDNTRTEKKSLAESFYF